MSFSPSLDRQLQEIKALLVDDHGVSRLFRVERKAEMMQAKLDLILQQLGIIMSKMDDFKTAFTAYVAQVQAWFDAANANQATSDAAVAAAVAQAQAGEDVDVQALSDQLAAAAAKVPAVPTAPPAVPTP